jgi:hypothetical protein
MAEGPLGFSSASHVDKWNENFLSTAAAPLPAAAECSSSTHFLRSVIGADNVFDLDDPQMSRDDHFLVASYLHRLTWIEKHRALGTFSLHSPAERARAELFAFEKTRGTFHRKRKRDI